MAVYPGSTYLDHSSKAYSFINNFLSDLGRTLSFSGASNFFACQLFNMALIFAGAVFVLFFIQLKNVFQDTRGMKNLSLVGSVFGIFGGFCLVGVGLTPSDLYLDLHIIFANWLFRFFFPTAFCYSWVIYNSAEFENKFALGYLVFSISILAYIFISELGPDPKMSQFALTLQVVSQKIILVIFMAAIYIQTIGLKRINQ